MYWAQERSHVDMAWSISVKPVWNVEMVRTFTYLEHVLGSNAYFQCSGLFRGGDVKNSCLPVVILSSVPFVCVLLFCFFALL